jgi:translocation and assembly module TamA
VWLLAALVAAAPAAAAPVRVQVAVDGISGEVRDNAMTVLSIAAAARRGPIEEWELRRLHAQAPDELRTSMQAFGYYRATVQSDLAREGGRWRARYTVTPGAPVVVRSIDLRVTGPGADTPAFRAAVAAFPLTEGQTLHHPAYQAGKAALREVAATAGYLDAAFDSSVVRINAGLSTAAIHLEFSTGERYRFGPVRFHQDALHPEFLAGYAEFRRGDPLNVNALIGLQKRLGDLPYFSTVEVVPRDDLAEDLEVPIDVNLTPSKPQRYLFGLGIGTDAGVHGRAGIELRRINRRAHRAETEVRISGIERTVSGQYFIPWPYPRTELLTVSGGYQDLDPQTSRSKTLRVGASLARGRGGARETYALTFQREDFEVGLDEGTSELLMPEVTWSFVRADDRIFTTRGMRVRARLRGAGERVGSDASFAQLSAGAKWIISPARRTRVLLRTDTGYTRTEAFRRLPPSVRFFAGGAQSVRGYAYQGLGPLDDDGHVIGGEALVVGSVELEQRLLENWGVAAFFDIGNAMRSVDDPLESGAGAGLRWRSPVGLIRADLAQALSVPGRPWRFHLALGPDL